MALEKGEISPNLHFTSPNSEIKALVEGRLKVVTDVTKFQDDRALIGIMWKNVQFFFYTISNFQFIGINSFGFGGGNCHVLIRGHVKEKENNGLPQDKLPRLVCFSGRSEESIALLHDYIAEIGEDAEFIGLLHNIFR